MLLSQNANSMPKHKPAKRARVSDSDTDTSIVITPLRKKCLVLEDSAIMESSNMDMSNTDTEIDVSKLSDRELAELTFKKIVGLEQRQNFNDFEITELQNKVTNLETKCKDQENEIETLRKEIKQIKTEQNDMKAYSMRDNLLIENIPTSPNENVFNLLNDLFVNKLGIANGEQIELVRAHRMPSNPMSRGPPAIIVRFLRYSDRMKVWSSRFKLKSSRAGASQVPRDIYIREHYPQDIEENRRRLSPVFYAAKSQDGLTRLIKDKIIYKHRAYGVDRVDQLIEALPDKGTKIGITENDAMCTYLGQYCPLSNFYKCTFSCDDTTFNCVEQGYQAAFAKHVGQDDIAHNIMKMTEPRDMKHATKGLPAGDWYSSGEAIKTMKALSVSKFEQCAKAKDVLISIKASTIAEANANDKYWGTGLGRYSSMKVVNDQFPGSNHMGRILMAIQQQLK